jgi:hypothetical protein
MPLQEYTKKDLPRDKWNRLTGESLFLSPDFLSLWGFLGGEEIFIADDIGSEFAAGIAGVVFGKGILRRIKYIPDWLYGGPIYKSSITSEEKSRFIAELYNYLKGKSYIRADIYNPSIEFPPDHFTCRAMSTHIISLDAGEYRPPDPMVLTDIRHGRKEGGTVVMLDNEKYLDQFYELAESTTSRHDNKNRYSRELLKRFWELSRKDKRVICPMVLSGEQVAAVHIYLKEKSQILYWQSYFDKRFNNLRPNYLILDYMIKYAQSIGIREFNLGGSPPGADSLTKFKESWGGKRVIYNYYTYYSILGKMLYRWRER